LSIAATIGSVSFVALCSVQLQSDAVPSIAAACVPMLPPGRRTACSSVGTMPLRLLNGSEPSGTPAPAVKRRGMSRSYERAAISASLSRPPLSAAACRFALHAKLSARLRPSQALSTGLDERLGERLFAPPLARTGR